MPVSQVRGGSEDLNRLDSDFLVLCNIENQPPASRPRKKKENKKEKEHRGNGANLDPHNFFGPGSDNIK